MATILVVDDRAVNREFLLTLLGYGGHRLLEASNGNEALRLAIAERPDLVISDLAMPYMDGYEFIRLLRSDPEISTRIIILSAAHLETEARALTRACGVSHYLTKPVEPMELLRVVDLVLDEAPPRPVPRSTLDEYTIGQHMRKLGKTIEKNAEALAALNEKLDRRIVEQTESLRAAHSRVETRWASDARTEESVKKAEPLPRSALRDPLTGLFSRRYLEESLQRELARANRGDDLLGVLLIALDQGKRVRDNFGHIVGDALLVAAADCLRALSGPKDILCRLEGEEFAVAMNGASLEEVGKRADAMHGGIHQLRVEGANLHVQHLTLSIGTAVYPGHGATSADLIKAADDALRKAKGRGGDCTVASATERAGHR
jgi:diguanylate cyclase (GGDEF)-like protein